MICSTKGYIEVRNDNDKRFSAKTVHSFFKENYFIQVFTHPYTPQENGHIESFRAIESRSLSRYHFDTLDELKRHPTIFFEKYKNTIIHGSNANLSPSVFWEQWNQRNIQRIVKKNKKVEFKLLILYYQAHPSKNVVERWPS